MKRITPVVLGAWLLSLLLGALLPCCEAIAESISHEHAQSQEQHDHQQAAPLVDEEHQHCDHSANIGGNDRTIIPTDMVIARQHKDDIKHALPRARFDANHRSSSLLLPAELGRAPPPGIPPYLQTLRLRI